uniref:50S ribosomal protein L32 n=1 Tax=Cutleria multifida TaxID=74475 RepID=UPI002E774AE7|nr:50S ribosomal protein L32 [Cutleria multifida]WAM62609.1 50S ribosomal protein L32 [Cutleria multifida]
MAVPKKRRSKAKSRTRLAIWKGKGNKSATRALTLAKSILNKNSKFIFDPKKEDENPESVIEQNNSED